VTIESAPNGKTNRTAPIFPDNSLPEFTA